MIVKLAARNHVFAERLQEGMDAAGGCMRLVMYHDAATPGNVLRADNQRKSTLFYVGFIELGRFLRSSISWITVAIVREGILEDLIGGISSVVKHIMRSFMPPMSTLMTTGVPVPLAGKFFLCRARFAALLADELALKASLGAKGASGLRPCIKCTNALRTQKDLDDFCASLGA